MSLASSTFARLCRPVRVDNMLACWLEQCCDGNHVGCDVIMPKTLQRKMVLATLFDKVQLQWFDLQDRSVPQRICSSVLNVFLTVHGTKLMLSNDTTISWIIGVYVFSKNIILCMFWVKMIMIIIMIINKMFLLTDLTVKVKNIIFKNANYELYISF